MTKADIVTQISKNTGIEKIIVLTTIESMMSSIEKSLSKGENVYLRGFGSFVIKKRAKKVARNISKNTAVVIPAHNIPFFKPVSSFVEEVRNKVK